MLTICISIYFVNLNDLDNNKKKINLQGKMRQLYD